MSSTTLFTLATFKTVTKLEDLQIGFKDGPFNITSLFLANDGMLLIGSVEGAERVAEQVVATGRKYGLEVNKQKSNIIVSNMNEKPQEMAGIKVSDKLKYLGNQQ